MLDKFGIRDLLKHSRMDSALNRSDCQSKQKVDINIKKMLKAEKGNIATLSIIL